MTVNAVDTVKRCPLQIYAQNEIIDTPTGASCQTAPNAISIYPPADSNNRQRHDDGILEWGGNVTYSAR